MFFDLNVPVPSLSTNSQSSSKKGKGKQVEAPKQAYTPAQISVLDARVDILAHLGYSVIAFTQTVHKKIDPKIHENVLDGLLHRLRKRPGIVFLKRLSIVLDEDSEKGFGLINANTSFFNGYDLIALVPTTHASFSLACLTHSLPSPLTAHIISLPLTLPRLSFYLKHTLVRTAIKNGAVFEINYVGALGGENDAVLVGAGVAESGAGAKRNWWASARELVRVTKGKALIVSGGVVAEADLRAPKDVGNLISILGLAQDAACSASTKVPKSLVVRAQTRKTYRAVLSEPKLVIPESSTATPVAEASAAVPEPTSATATTLDALTAQDQQTNAGASKKRPLEDLTTTGDVDSAAPAEPTSADAGRKKKRKKGNKATA
ncbi:RNase P subunit p30-domain-containing protein [Crucibulum laeve]|uniref:RNase P subunit p30-domain-containing protein n=1 Tax=Crucibulum laeve TaxID=68775 RepID=A0A5C3LHN2_9AGAR|nr:RNase P subunit p30-domain-containing protein [Crucibulum laeve]